MMLGDRDIQHVINRGELKIDPLNDDWLQPTSIDLRLDRHFRAFDWTRIEVVDPAEETPTFAMVKGTEFLLAPGEFLLGSTFEQIELGPRLAGRVEGKSSLGRLGLAVHSTAGFIDPGFRGHVTLELTNFSQFPIVLRPGMKIAQLCLFQLMNAVDRPYGSEGIGSRYQDQVGPTASRSHLNFTTVSTTRNAT